MAIKHISDPFKYVSAADSAKPGYLADKFAKIIAERKRLAAQLREADKRSEPQAAIPIEAGRKARRGK